MPDETRELLVREVPVGIPEGGDGRTIEARIVPYNTPTVVADHPKNGGTGVPYTEVWLPGAFERQTSAVNRVPVWLNFEHEQGLRGIVGHGAELVERDDALYGSFRVHQNSDGDKALQMVADNVLTGISLEARPMRSRRLGDVVERLRAHLEAVSLCRIGAYSEAVVLAVRQPEETDAPEPDEPAPDVPAPPDPVPTDAELALQRVGWEPLVVRAVTRKPWVPLAARFADDEYQRSCLIDRGGDRPVKERCSLPVLEPDGDINVRALELAAQTLAGARGGLGGVGTGQKAQAARKLIRYYSQAELDPPPALRQVAAR